MSTIKFVVSVVAIELLRNPQIKRGIVSASYPFSRPLVSLHGLSKWDYVIKRRPPPCQ